MKSTSQKIGTGINYFLSAVLVISGTLKLIQFAPYMEVVKTLNPAYFENIYLIGFVALISGILFAIPKTFTYGFIAALAFLGGTISAHMQAGDLFIPQIVFVILTGLTAYLKKPDWFSN